MNTFLVPSSGGSLGSALLVALTLTVPLDIVARSGKAVCCALPPPAQDSGGKRTDLQTAVFAGGCFWGVQGVFEHVQGCHPGSLGLRRRQCRQPRLRAGEFRRHGPRRVGQRDVRPAPASATATLLQIFFSVALDPTQVDRQGPDWGTQYRSGAVRQAVRSRSGWPGPISRS